MSANLLNSAALARAGWFQDLVQSAMVEYALTQPTDPLARLMVRDPSHLVPVFVRIVADNATISADEWTDVTDQQKQDDVRYAISAVWVALGAALPNLGA